MLKFNGQYTDNHFNKLDKIDSKKEYTLRLTAVMLEAGVASNSVIAESRIQAVVYVTDKCLLGR